MSINDRIRKLCRICGDVGSINIFGSMGQSLDLSEKINTLLPTNVSTTYTLLQYNYYYFYFYSWFVDKAQRSSFNNDM